MVKPMSDDELKRLQNEIQGTKVFETLHPTKPDDPAYQLLLDDHTSTPIEGLYRQTCFICRDPEFAQMGLPLCYPCVVCKGHVPADDSVCENGHENNPSMMDPEG
jgi:hypothetical protein